MKIVVNECEDNQQILLRTSINNDKKNERKHCGRKWDKRDLWVNTAHTRFKIKTPHIQVHVSKTKHLKKFLLD